MTPKQLRDIADFIERHPIESFMVGHDAEILVSFTPHGKAKEIASSVKELVWTKEQSTMYNYEIDYVGRGSVTLRIYHAEKRPDVVIPEYTPQPLTFDKP